MWNPSSTRLDTYETPGFHKPHGLSVNRFPRTLQNLNHFVLPCVKTHLLPVNPPCRSVRLRDRPPRHEVGVAGCAVNGLRRQPGAPRQRGRGCCYGRAVVRRVCGHVARRLAYQRGQVCQERLAIEFPAALPAPDGHAPRSPFRRETTITARAGHRTRPVIFAPDAPPARPPLQRRFHVGPGDHASPAPAACRSRCRCFRRASFTSGNPRATASRITAETDTPAASASASSAAAVAGSTVTRNCFE